MSLPTFVYDLDAVLQGQRPRLPEVGEIARLDGAEGRHAVSVKRIVAGERIKLIDAHGAYAEALVTETSGKDRLAARVEINETQSLWAHRLQFSRRFLNQSARNWLLTCLPKAAWTR